MMPHEWCQQSNRCWLHSLFSHTGFTDLPQFRLGQLVEMPWVDDETEELRIDRGVIVGFTIAAPARWNKPGWIYFVRRTENQSSPWLSPNHVEEVLESELREVS